MSRPIRFPKLHDREWLQERLQHYGSQLGVAEELGCTTTAVYQACKKFGIETPPNSTLFKKGQPSANPRAADNLTFRWPKGTKPESFTMTGRRHTDEAKQKISDNSWSRTGEGKAALSELQSAAWERDDGTRREKTRETMRGVGQLNAGKVAHNRKPRVTKTCMSDRCNNQFEVRESSKRIYCSIGCASRSKRGKMPPRSEESRQRSREARFRHIQLKTFGCRCSACKSISGRRTVLERLLVHLILREYPTVEQQCKSFSPYVVDAYLPPPYHLVFEADGEYWHRRRVEEDKKRDNYLLDRYNLPVVRIPGRDLREAAMILWDIQIPEEYVQPKPQRPRKFNHLSKIASQKEVIELIKLNGAQKTARLLGCSLNTIVRACRKFNFDVTPYMPSAQPISDETRQKLSAALQRQYEEGSRTVPTKFVHNQPHTDESRQKMSMSHTGRPAPNKTPGDKVCHWPGCEKSLSSAPSLSRHRACSREHAFLPGTTSRNGRPLPLAADVVLDALRTVGGDIDVAAKFLDTDYQRVYKAIQLHGLQAEVIAQRASPPPGAKQLLSDRETVISLYAEHGTTPKVAAAIGVSAPMVQRYVHKHGLEQLLGRADRKPAPTP